MATASRPNPSNYFATHPQVDPDLGAKLDEELNSIISNLNSLDNENIDGTPKIDSSKVDFATGGFVEKIGDEMSGALEHIFDGIWRKMRASGNARVYEYQGADGALWGISYNARYDGGWQGRDVTGICMAVKIESNGIHFYYAVSGASGSAPSWTEIFHVDTSGAIVTLIKQADLKTSIGSVETTSSGVNLTLPGGQYGFYPQTEITGGYVLTAYIASGAIGATPITNIYLGVSNGTGRAYQRYITSSGKDHWIFILYDIVKNQIISSWEAPDHPSYGQGGDETEIPHPFADYLNKPLPANLKIILLDNAQIDELKAKRTRKKGILQTIATEYEIDFTSQLQYKPREIIEIDEYGDRKGEVIKGNLKRREVKTLPAIVEYRSLKLK